MTKESSFMDKKERTSKAVVFENAQLLDENKHLRQLEQQYAAELSIINSVQSALTENLDIQAIYDIVGDKIQAVFNAQTVIISSFDEQTNIRTAHYYVEKGEHFHCEPAPLGELPKNLIRNRKTLVFNENSHEQVAKFGMNVTPGSAPTRSAVFVPLMVGTRVFGLISLQDVDHDHAFPETKVRLLETLASSMSVSLENVRLFNETQRLLKVTEERNAELAIINSMREGLASKLDIKAIYDLIGSKIREIFHADTTYIATYIEGDEFVFSQYYVERENTPIYIQPLPFGTGLYTHIIRTRKPLLLGTNEQQQELGAVDIASPKSKKDLNESFLAVPIFLSETRTGILSVQSYQKNAYTESDIRLLQTLANSMSAALENARLFDETQRLLTVTEQRATELQIINSVQTGLATKLDMQAIYDLVGDRIRDLFNAQSVLILTFDPLTRTRQVKYNFEKGQRFYTLTSLPFNKLTDHLLATKETLLFTQGTDSRVTEFEMTVLPGTEGFKSAVFVPLIAGSDVKGFISVQNMEQENAFSESDVNLLSTFASSMSVAIENARLYEEQLHVAEELKQVDTMKSQFLSSMSHELRTPLNAIINFVEMIAKGMIGPVNNEQEELLGQALNNSKHLLHLINDVLDISKIQAGKLTLFIEDQINLQEEAQTVLSMVDGLARQKNLQLISDIDPNLPMIACDRRRLRQVFLNLLSNAIKFTEQGTITLSVKNRRHEVLFAVIDTGPGIPQIKQQIIFEAFMQAGDSAKLMQGTGLGLPISRSLVRAHGGELWVDSEDGDGCSFFFTLPVSKRIIAV